MKRPEWCERKYRGICKCVNYWASNNGRDGYTCVGIIRDSKGKYPDVDVLSMCESYNDYENGEEGRYGHTVMTIEEGLFQINLLSEAIFEYKRYKDKQKKLDKVDSGEKEGEGVD